MKISGFTFGHNLITGGFPFVEAISAVKPYVDELIAVDIESTDGTKDVLLKLCDKVLTSPWGGRDTTPNAFLKHVECSGEVIIFFEADEVYDDSLLKAVKWMIGAGHTNLGVYRLQLEQNFQKCRQYPLPVHRIFTKGAGTYHVHPTIYPENARIPLEVIPPEFGYLWDCSNVFRDNWQQRKATQSEIWGEPRHLMVAEHFTEAVEISQEEEIERLKAPCWEWVSTPFNVPTILKPLIGKTKYTCQP